MKQGKIRYEGQSIYRIATGCLIFGIFSALISDMLHLQVALSYPCLLDHYLHVYCGGCGGTRAMYALFRLQLLQSIKYNPLVIYGVGLFMYYYIGTTLAVLNGGKKIYFKPRWWMLVGLIVLLIYTVVIRNVLAIRFGIDFIGDIAPYWH